MTLSYTEELLVLGDSFCYHRLLDSDWPLRLSNLLQVPLSGVGFGGGSWWYVRNYLYKVYLAKNKLPEIVVFCHTNPHRIPAKTAIGLNGFSSYRRKDKIGVGAQYYYEYIHNEEYNVWTQEAWFKELDIELYKYEESKILHIICFPKSSTNYRFRTGVNVGERKNSFMGRSIPWIPGDTSHNHFSTEDNIKIANFLYNIIENYNKTPKEVPFII